MFNKLTLLHPLKIILHICRHHEDMSNGSFNEMSSSTIYRKDTIVTIIVSSLITRSSSFHHY